MCMIHEAIYSCSHVEYRYGFCEKSDYNPETKFVTFCDDDEAADTMEQRSSYRKCHRCRNGGGPPLPPRPSAALSTQVCEFIIGHWTCGCTVPVQWSHCPGDEHDKYCRLDEEPMSMREVTRNGDCPRCRKERRGKKKSVKKATVRGTTGKEKSDDKEPTVNIVYGAPKYTKTKGERSRKDPVININVPTSRGEKTKEKSSRKDPVMKLSVTETKGKKPKEKEPERGRTLRR